MVASEIFTYFLALGLSGSFAIALAEKLVPVVPSYVVLMLLGMSVPHGSSVLPMLLATAAGSLSGTMIWYGLGRMLGEQRVEAVVCRFGRYVFFKPSAYRRLADSYRSNRFWVTAIGQVVPVARIYLALPAGVFRLQPRSFVPAALLGILAWNAPFLLLGLELRGTTHDLSNVGLFAAAILICVEVAVVALLSRIRRIAGAR